MSIHRAFDSYLSLHENHCLCREQQKHTSSAGRTTQQQHSAENIQVKRALEQE